MVSAYTGSSLRCTERESLQMFRILHYAITAKATTANTVDRPTGICTRISKDMDAGIYTRNTAHDLLEDFFISVNKDSDPM